MLPDDEPYSARMVPGTAILARRLVEQHLTVYPNTKVVLCFDSEATDNDSFSKAVENIISEFTAKNGSNAQFLTQADGFDCQLNSPRFDAAAKAAEFVTAGVETVLFSPYIDRVSLATNMASQLARAAQTQGKARPRLLGSPTLFTGKTLEENASAFEGLQLPAPWHSQAVSGSSFPKQAEAIWGGRVAWRTAMAYDSVQVVAAGLRQEPTRSGVLGAFKRDMKGATGMIRFGKRSGDRLMTDSLDDIMEIKAMPGSPHGFDFVLKP